MSVRESGAPIEPNDRERVSAASRWYLEQQLDVDKLLIEYRYRTIRRFMRGPSGLELGSAEGQMTRFLYKDFERLTVVEGAKELLDAMPAFPNVQKVHTLFEDFEPGERFDTVILEHILEHVEHPEGILVRARSWVAADGRLIAGVPNANSIHRLVGVKMGLLSHQTDLNARDIAQGHRRVYTPDAFKAELSAAGLRVVAFGGVFLKPLSNQQIQDHWPPELKEAFFQLGKDFPMNAADLFAVCELP